MTEELVIVLRDLDNNILEEFKASILVNGVLRRFVSNKRYWRDPALEWCDLEQQLYLIILELINNRHIDYDSSKSSLKTWMFMKCEGGLKDYLKSQGVVHQPHDKQNDSNRVEYEPYLSVDEDSEEVVETSHSTDNVLDDSVKELIIAKCYEYLDNDTSAMMLYYHGIIGSEPCKVEELQELYGLSRRAVYKRLNKAASILAKDDALKETIGLLKRASNTPWAGHS